MKKNKYKVIFYTIKGVKFIRICTRTKWSVIKYALKTAIKQKAVFKIVKCKNNNDNKRITSFSYSY